MNQEIISEDFASKYKNKQPNWGFNGLGYIVYKRTYARLKDDGNTEEWHETIRRCINGSQKIGANYTKQEAERLFDLVFNLKCNFAGRMLWQLGTSTVDRFGANSLLNCWMVQMNEPNALLFLFENLMLGGGVGYSIRREDVHELPKIKAGVKISHQATKDADFIVPDSREGWVKLLSNLLDAFYSTGKSFTYSTILVRGYGEIIKGFGGKASGPQILIEGIEKITKIFQSRESKKLRSVDVLDICNIIGSIVVAGNVRRSAEIALGDPDDILYLRAKNWSSGSVPNWRAMSNNTIYADAYSHLMDEFWTNGYEINKETGFANGEPYGLFNLPLSQKYGRIKDGLLKDSSLYPVDMDNCVGTNPCVTGDTKILIKGKNGTPLQKNIKSLVGKKVEIWNGNEWSLVEPRITGFNQKILKVKTSSGKYLKCTYNHSFILKNETRVKAIELKIGDELLQLPNHPIYKSNISENIISIEDAGISEAVYCFTEYKRNRGVFNEILTGQCGEISLSNYECCNLSELYLNNISSEEELIECATLLYKTQKAIAALPFLHDETNKIVHKNMRLGLGVTGVCQSLDKLDWLDNCYIALRKYDKEWSKKRGWPESVKLTTIKPSGTLSLLGGATPGVHPAYSQYYFRTVRMSSSDKLVQTCKDLGYHVEFLLNFDGTENRDTVVVYFPCETPEGSILTKDMNVIKQLDLVKKTQSIWADNAVSVTAYYNEEELPELKKWLKENYKNNIKSVSFLLHQKHGFKQAPYQEIDEKTYREARSKVKSLNNVKISSGSTIDGIECVGGACPIR